MVSPTTEQLKPQPDDLMEGHPHGRPHRPTGEKRRAVFRIWRGGAPGAGGGGGKFVDYPTEVTDGMVVLDAVHQIQAEQANDLAVRWNCKAGKCGSCSAEVNGKPCLMCMTRLDQVNLDMHVTIEPMQTFPLIKDLVTDVSWNFEVKKKIKQFTPRPQTPEEKKAGG